MSAKPQPRYHPGDKIGGRYQVHKALMGGMGEVYLCLDLETIQPYALKTFQQRYLTEAQRLRRAFEQEVGTWVALEKHPNIVRCFYLYTLDNQPFMFLEWVAGEEGRGTDLRSWLRHGPLDLRLALEIAIDICRGLSHAQEKQPGLVHRDLKPENILIAQSGLAKITDFGLAHIAEQTGLAADITTATDDGRQSMMGAGGIVGTPPYMAPEQWLLGHLDVRTDIYAVGCILYEMLTGQHPFPVDVRPTTPETAEAWLSEMRSRHIVGHIPQLPDSLPSALNKLIQSCLAKSPEERPSSAAELTKAVTSVYNLSFDQPPPVRSTTGQFIATDFSDRGTTYQHLGRYEEALADYEQAISLDPNLAQAYTNRGVTYAELGRSEEALADYDQAISLDPNYADAYTNRGVTYAELGRSEEALADHDKAISLDPNDAKAYSSRGTTYAALGRSEEALADFAKAISIAPNEAKAYSNRGLTYHAFGRSEEALADFDQAISLDPKDAKAYYNRGTTYAALGRREEALADFAKAISIAPNDAKAYSNRGGTYHTLGRSEEALADYDQAISLDPNDAKAYYNRGVTYDALGRREEALADYDQAISLDPNDAKAYFNLGALLANDGQLQAALPYFDQAARLGDSQAVTAANQVRKMLGVPAQESPGQQAFDAFARADTPEAMRQAVMEFPFMLQDDFIAAVVQTIIQQVPPEHRPAFEQRLSWLRQIAQQQRK